MCDFPFLMDRLLIGEIQPENIRGCTDHQEGRSREPQQRWWTLGGDSWEGL